MCPIKNGRSNKAGAKEGRNPWKAVKSPRSHLNALLFGLVDENRNGGTSMNLYETLSITDVASFGPHPLGCVELTVK